MINKKTKDEEVQHFIELQKKFFDSVGKKYAVRNSVDFPVNMLLGFGS